MTKQQITQRNSEFQKAVARHAKKIFEIGNASWNPINEKSEPATVRAFLKQNVWPLLTRSLKV